MMRPLIALLAGWITLVVLAALTKPLGIWEDDDE